MSVSIVKKNLLLIALLFGLIRLNAQEQNSMKLKIEAGLLWDSLDEQIFLSGPFLNVEPKLKTSKNTVTGLRLGGTLNTQRVLITDPNQFYINNNIGSVNGMISLVPTFDYYFGKSNFKPYLGVGVGYNILSTSKKAFETDNSSNGIDLTINNQVGFLLRGGFNLHKLVIRKLDMSKFILGIEYNYLPKVNVETLNSEIVGTINNSYFGISIGSFILN